MADKLFALCKIKAGSAMPHWLLQRVTAIILVPLTFQLILFLDVYFNSPRQQAIEWLTSPVNMLSVAGWLVIVCYHSALGLQVVFEDYVGDTKLQQSIIKWTNWGFLALTLGALLILFNIK